MIIGLYSPAAQSGKTTVARELERRGYCILPFAQPLRDMLSAMLRGVGYKQEEIDRYMYEDKEAVLSPFGVSFRHMARTLGTEWGRECVGPDVWTTHWLERVRSHSFVVVDDVRFANEAELVRTLGGQMWKVTRPGVERATEHASEGGLDKWPHFTHDIINAGTLQDLLSGLPSIPLGPNGVNPTRNRVDVASKDR